MKGTMIVKKLKSIASLHQNYQFKSPFSSPDLIEDNKENIIPSSSKNTKEQHHPISAFRKPKICSETLFDPNLLQSFDEAVSQYYSRLHPDGARSVILYTTSVRGIRKTFEDCERVRFLLRSFGIMFYERDVSMHAQFRHELRDVLEHHLVTPTPTPPRLFIKGIYIGGADQVLVLHEQGMFRPLFDGIPRDPFNGRACHGCAGFRFVLCSECSGSRKLPVNDPDSDSAAWSKCMNCNENGLIICNICSSS